MIFRAPPCVVWPTIQRLTLPGNGCTPIRFTCALTGTSCCCSTPAISHSIEAKRVR